MSSSLITKQNLEHISICCWVGCRLDWIGRWWWGCRFVHYTRDFVGICRIDFGCPRLVPFCRLSLEVCSAHVLQQCLPDTNTPAELHPKFSLHCTGWPYSTAHSRQLTMGIHKSRYFGSKSSLLDIPESPHKIDHSIEFQPDIHIPVYFPPKPSHSHTAHKPNHPSWRY